MLDDAIDQIQYALFGKQGKEIILKFSWVVYQLLSL